MSNTEAYTKGAIDLRMKNLNPSGTTVTAPTNSDPYITLKHDDDETAMYSISIKNATAGGLHGTIVLPYVNGQYPIAPETFDTLNKNGNYSLRIQRGYTDANNVTDYRISAWDDTTDTMVSLLSTDTVHIVKFTPTQALTN